MLPDCLKSPWLGGSVVPAWVGPDPWQSWKAGPTDRGRGSANLHTKVHMAYRRGNGRPQTADCRLQTGVRAGYV